MPEDPREERVPTPEKEHPIEVARIGELVRRLCVAKSNLDLYSFDHQVTQRNIEATWEFLTGLLEEWERVSLDIHKNNILFEGLPIEERNPMVERLARDFRNLRVRGLTFHRGLTLKDLAIFFKMLTVSRELLETRGGAGSLLKELGVVTIVVNQARYVRLEEDQKVVSTSVKVAGAVEGEDDARKELLGHLWDALMRQQVDREWLLEEIRTDPARAASQIVGLMKYYDNVETVEDQQRQQEAIETLLGSVQALGMRLAERDQDGEGASAENVANSLVQLERELKARSAGLKTSRAAARFIQEITNTVTAFIDTHQADRIAKEFLKDEKGLKRTEQLLREVVGRDRETAVVDRLRRLVEEKKIDEAQLKRVIERARGEAEPRGRVRRKRAPKPVREKIARALAPLLKEEETDGKTADYLAGLFEREMRGRVEAERSERTRLEGAISRLDEAVTSSGLGLVILDRAGRVVLETGLARSALGDLDGTVFAPALARFLAGEGHRDAAARAAFLEEAGAEAGPAARILEHLSGVFVGEDGVLLGFAVGSAAAEKAPPPETSAPEENGRDRA